MLRSAVDVYLVVGLLAVVQQLPLSRSSMTCTKENGDPVDWFVVYKLPKVPVSANKLIANGTAYLYWTSDMDAKMDDWTLSSTSIGSETSLAGQTLSQLYSKDKADRLLAMYNDEFPNGTTTFNLGHTKGVIAADPASGFWMIHSVPRFPPSPLESRNYAYPLTATIFGQTMLCITLRTPQIDLIGSQMKLMAPFVYHWNIPGILEKEVPNLLEAVRGVRIKQPPWFQNQFFPSAGGLLFHSFAKAKQFGKDLYADWMAPALGTSLAVETWQNGEGKIMPSDCNNTFTTENVKGINLTSTSFTSHRDHSKWAIALNRTTPWICIGDINRMESQKKRGGGSVCFLHETLWDKFHQSAAVLEPCPIINLKSSANCSRQTTCSLFYFMFLFMWHSANSIAP